MEDGENVRIKMVSKDLIENVVKVVLGLIDGPAPIYLGRAH